MVDETPVLTPEEIREEAREILLAIGASRDYGAAFEDNWRKLWQLVREAKAAYLPGLAEGPWSLSGHADQRVFGASLNLTAGSFDVPIWPPEEARSGTYLPGLLNWAGVPIPMDDRRSADQSGEGAERAREAAERRREQEELHRRLSEEGRQVAETIRARHEEFREEGEATRSESERFRDAQEATRELAEQAREMAEAVRRAAEDARVLLSDAREALSDLKDLAQRQRVVLERQEKAIAAFEGRTRGV